MSAVTYRRSSICLYLNKPDSGAMSKQITTTEKIARVDEATFESAVIDSNVPVFVDFYADWCGPCHMIEPTIQALSEEYDGKVKFVKINIDNNQELAMKYDVMSIPTGMLFENGTVKDSLVGALPAWRYQQLIDRALGSGGLKTGKQ
jgi:thioredoxin 1